MLRAAVVVLCAAVLGLGQSGPGATPPFTSTLGRQTPASDEDVGTRRDWGWPFSGFRVAAPFIAPAHPYGPGHRGIDLDAVGTTGVMSPAAGVVAFSGSVAGRGVVTVDHGDGLVTTLEPVEPRVEVGTAVERGTLVAVLANGGHASAGSLHFGVRYRGEYVNPMLLLGEVPRAILYPCC